MVGGVLVFCAIGLYVAVTWGQNHPVRETTPPSVTLPALRYAPAPGATFCSMRKAQPSAVEALTLIKVHGQGSWTIENISASNLAQVAPGEVHPATATYAAAIRAWPHHHASIDAATAVAAAQTIDAYTTAHCSQQT
jgi:hypothetical protein